MTAAFWWYVLAGFIVGFCLSTVWEWLYFRKRRMRITDRRIAALEQALRTQESGAANVEVLPEPGVTWSATEYQSPGVLLENEEDVESTRRVGAPVATATAYTATTTVRNGYGQAGDGKDKSAPWIKSSEADVVSPSDTLQADRELSAGEKAAIGVAAAGTAAAMAKAIATQDESAPESPPVQEVEVEQEDEGIATTGIAAATAKAIATQDESASESAAVQALEAEEEDEDGDALAKAVVAGAAVAAALISDDEATSAVAEPVAEEAASQVAPELAGEEIAEVITAEALAAVAAEQAGNAAAPDGGERQDKTSAPHSDTSPQATTEVRGFSARQGYIVSELSPGEFTALQATQKARQAARKAWEQARAVTDYLRNV